MPRPDAQRVSKIAVEVLKKYDEVCVTFFSAGVTDDIFEQAWPGSKAHPLDKSRKVLNALDRESKKPLAMFRKSDVNIWGRKIRAFELKEEYR